MASFAGASHAGAAPPGSMAYGTGASMYGYGAADPSGRGGAGVYAPQGSYATAADGGGMLSSAAPTYGSAWQGGFGYPAPAPASAGAYGAYSMQVGAGGGGSWGEGVPGGGYAPAFDGGAEAYARASQGHSAPHDAGASGAPGGAYGSYFGVPPGSSFGGMAPGAAGYAMPGVPGPMGGAGRRPSSATPRSAMSRAKAVLARASSGGRARPAAAAGGSVASSVSSTAPRGTIRGRDEYGDEDDDEEDEDDDGASGGGEGLERSRERNRMHARKSRMRKKIFIQVLKDDVARVEKEETQLLKLVVKHTGRRYDELRPLDLAEDADAPARAAARLAAIDAEDDPETLPSGKSAAARQERCRERNRIHARKSRLRKKALMEGLKEEITFRTDRTGRIRAFLAESIGPDHPDLMAVAESGASTAAPVISESDLTRTMSAGSAGPAPSAATSRVRNATVSAVAKVAAKRRRADGMVPGRRKSTFPANLGPSGMGSLGHGGVPGGSAGLGYAGGVEGAIGITGPGAAAVGTSAAMAAMGSVGGAGASWGYEQHVPHAPYAPDGYGAGAGAGAGVGFAPSSAAATPAVSAAPTPQTAPVAAPAPTPAPAPAAARAPGGAALAEEPAPPTELQAAAAFVGLGLGFDIGSRITGDASAASFGAGAAPTTAAATTPLSMTVGMPAPSGASVSPASATSGKSGASGETGAASGGSGSGAEAAAKGTAVKWSGAGAKVFEEAASGAGGSRLAALGFPNATVAMAKRAPGVASELVQAAGSKAAAATTSAGGASAPAAIGDGGMLALLASAAHAADGAGRGRAFA